ncbi:glycosyltransferase [Olivibacter sp. CPCC 100613]|uniref:glycosyltransferase family protein n=1 Tax=Olivibacter sp. CPCC 100613 TaxID=3079931 RepID=UPI002FF86BD7
MKVAYCYHKNNKHTYAGDTIALGFANAFRDMGYPFRFFNTNKLRGMSTEKLKMCLFNPDMIFTSVENINLLPLDYLKQKKLVLWGQFYTSCDYEEQIHCINTETKLLLNKYRDKHDILIWSQHEEEINEYFFSGYHKELGLKFIQLIHAADKSIYKKPIVDIEYDFIWIGNTSHRKVRYEKWITPLKKVLPNFLEFNEHSMCDPKDIYKGQYYAKSLISPNIHTSAQVKHKILLNERVFTSTLNGAFQICDNPIAKKYFTDDELLIAKTPQELIDLCLYYLKHPNERVGMIGRMSQTIMEHHTYHERIKSILSTYKIIS